MNPPDIRVLAELRTGEAGGRIDLHFAWQVEDGKRYAVGVEFKLEHHLTDGQLEGYWRFLRKGTDFHTGYLVTKSGAEKLRGVCRERWGLTAWVWLLRRFEILQAGEVPKDADPQFQLFRSSLWPRILWY